MIVKLLISHTSLQPRYLQAQKLGGMTQFHITLYKTKNMNNLTTDCQGSR